MSFIPKLSKAEIGTSAKSLKEGDTLVTTVSTKNVKAGTTLYWTLSGKGISATDFDKGDLKGSGIVSRTGSFAFKHALSPDRTTEGDEKLIITLFSDRSLRTPIAETVVAILDSSTASRVPLATPSYELAPSSTSLTEGDILTTTVNTKNVKAGTPRSSHQLQP